MARNKLKIGVRCTEVALDILEMVAFAEAEIGVSAIAAQLGLAKSAVFRHLQTLADRGYIMRNAATARYRLGIKLQLLAKLTRGEGNLLAAAEGPMTDLRNALGETVVLSAVERSGARVVATTRGSATVEIGVRVGSLLPFESSAQGKIMLAFAPPDLPKQYLQGAAHKKVLSALQRDLDRARRQGCLESAGEVMPGINAIAAPVFNASDVCVGAIAVVGLFPLSPRDRAQRYVSALVSSAKHISTNLGRRDRPAVAADISARSNFLRRAQRMGAP